MSASYLRKYGTGTGADIYINIPKAGSANHAVSADWTPAAGDVKISKDGGAAANIGTLPTAVAMGNSTIWKFVFADAELQAAFVSVTISDSATKAVDDTGFSIETYGNASAQHAVDLDDSVRAGLTALPNAAAEAAGGLYTRGTGAGQLSQTANGELGVVTLTKTATDLTNLPAITANWLTAAGIADDAFTAGKFATDCLTNDALAASFVTEIQTGLATSAEITALNDLSTADIDARLAAIRLDELLSADSDIDGAAPPTVGSVFHELMSKTAGSFTFDQTTDSLQAIRDRGDAAWTTAAGFSTHSAADVWSAATRTLTALDEDSTTIDLDAAIRAAVGLASANLDTQLTAIDDYLDTEVAAILAAVDTEVAAILVDTGTDIPATLAGLFTTALTESYNTDGSAPTAAQALCGILQAMTEGAISGTTWTVKKLDGSTTAMSITLDSSSAPTSKTRAS